MLNWSTNDGFDASLLFSAQFPLSNFVASGSVPVWLLIEVPNSEFVSFMIKKQKPFVFFNFLHKFKGNNSL